MGHTPLPALLAIELLPNFLKLIQKPRKNPLKYQLRPVKPVLTLVVLAILNRKNSNLFIKFGKLNKRKKLRKKLVMI